MTLSTKAQKTCGSGQVLYYNCPINALQVQEKTKVSMASIGGLFAETVRIADQHPPESFRLIVEGDGKIGFVKGEGLLTLVDQGESTEVKFDGDVQVGGTIASVGQRLLDTTSKLIIKKFFEKFSESAKTALSMGPPRIEAGGVKFAKG
jgi:carbon monoxide dehydrogenase subunit G